MLRIEPNKVVLAGSKGALRVQPGDEITLKLAMLFEGRCEDLGPTAAARELGYTKQRYSQVLNDFRNGDADHATTTTYCNAPAPGNFASTTKTYRAGSQEKAPQPDFRLVSWRCELELYFSCAKVLPFVQDRVNIFADS